MTTPLLWGSFASYWNVYHKITFDADNKLILINSDVTTLDIESDIYSSWKEWSLIDDNLKYLPAFRTTGGDPLPGGRRVGQYFFLLNGWKLVPPVTLTGDIQLEGNLFSDDGSDIFIAQTNRDAVLIRQVVSQFTEIASPIIDTEDITVTVSGSGLTAQESAQLSGLVTVNNQQTASLDTILTSQSLAYAQLVNQTQLLLLQSASLSVQMEQLTQQSASIATINIKTDTLLTNTASGSLTPVQATMLLEMYNLLGLDPTLPLIVSPTARDAGDISQTIVKVGDTVTVTRNP